jgi:hypothetical protein
MLCATYIQGPIAKLTAFAAATAQMAHFGPPPPPPRRSRRG